VAKAYFENTTSLQEKNPKDFELVKKWTDVMKK
jgi:hypothetical protein